MSIEYEIYFIGGPLDMTKQVKTGDPLRNGRLLRALAPFERPISPWMVGDADTQQVRTHRYELSFIGESPDRFKKIFVALWAGPEL